MLHLSRFKIKILDTQSFSLSIFAVKHIYKGISIKHTKQEKANIVFVAMVRHYYPCTHFFPTIKHFPCVFSLRKEGKKSREKKPPPHPQQQHKKDKRKERKKPLPFSDNPTFVHDICLSQLDVKSYVELFKLSILLLLRSPGTKVEMRM